MSGRPATESPATSSPAADRPAPHARTFTFTLENHG